MVASSLLTMEGITEKHEILWNQRHWSVNWIKAFNIWPKQANSAAASLGFLSQHTRSRFSTPGQEDKLPALCNDNSYKREFVVKGKMVEHPEIAGFDNFLVGLYTTNLTQDTEPIDLSFSKI